MEKIFAPIGRFSFFIYTIILSIISFLAAYFIYFFATDLIQMLLFTIIYLFLLLFLVLKRLNDIFKSKKNIIIFLFIFLLPILIRLCLAFALNNGFNIKNYHFLIFDILEFIFWLFLVIKKGKEPNDSKPKLKPVFIQTTVAVFAFSIVFTICSSYANSAMRIPNDQMYPSIEATDNILVKKISKSTVLKRNDIVCIGTELRPYRIIGLPNEKVILKGKDVFINGTKINNEYAFYSKNLMPLNFNEQIKLDGDSYFLMGDNRYYDETGKIRFFSKKKKTEVWKDIEIYIYDDPNKIRIFSVAKKGKIKGKVVGVHYINYKNKKLLSSFKFSSKGSDFGFKQKTMTAKKFGREE